MVEQKNKSYNVKGETIMKTKNANNLVVGVILTLFTIIIVGIVILWGTGYFGQNKKTLDKSTAKIDRAIGSMSEFDLNVYDDRSIRGDTLTKLVEDMTEDGVMVSIGVKTLGAASVSYYNYGYEDKNISSSKVTTTPTPVKSASNYINPNGTFLGEVLRNVNDDIVCILFTQQP